MKSYLLNHIQGFQKCKNHKNIPAGSRWIDLQKYAPISEHTKVFMIICIFEGQFTNFQLEYFDDFCTFGILVYALVNKISFLEQSEHFDFWRLLLAHYCLLAIVDALWFWPKSLPYIFKKFIIFGLQDNLQTKCILHFSIRHSRFKRPTLRWVTL